MKAEQQDKIIAIFSGFAVALLMFALYIAFVNPNISSHDKVIYVLVISLVMANYVVLYKNGSSTPLRRNWNLRNQWVIFALFYFFLSIILFISGYKALAILCVLTFFYNPLIFPVLVIFPFVSLFFWL